MIIVLYLQTGDKYIKQPAWPIQSSKMKKLKAINNLLDSALPQKLVTENPGKFERRSG